MTCDELEQSDKMTCREPPPTPATGRQATKEGSGGGAYRPAEKSRGSSRGIGLLLAVN